MRIELEVPGLALYARGPFAWFRVFGYGLHFRHRSAGLPTFSDRRAKHLSILGWQVKALVPSQRSDGQP